MCTFTNCEAYGLLGGGAVYVTFESVVEFYGNSFIGNKVAQGGGGDIYLNSGTCNIHSTCPPPYEHNVPMRNDVVKTKGVDGGLYFSQTCVFFHCDAGQHNPSIGETVDACVDCQAGKFSHSGTTSCSPCAPGTFSPTKADECSDCRRGTYAKEYSTLDCTKCPLGKYLPSEGSTSEFQCQNCRAGNYSAATGAPQCESCPSGTYSPDMAIACTDCPPGWYSSSPSSEKCNKCSTGKFASAAKSTT